MTRRGGVSTGAAASLNCGYGAEDDRAAVEENRRRAGEAVLPGASIVGVYQIHSPDVVMVREPWTDAERPRADALVTDRPGVLLAILTADCAPVLFTDCEAGVVGAAHAGWRGAHSGVIGNTVAAMEALGARAERIVAAVGPCIAQGSYEVTDDFQRQFTDAEACFFAAGRSGHRQFDLPGYVAHRLSESGVGLLEVLNRDTYREEEMFFSFRRSTHRGEPTYGRQISLIGLG